MCPRRESNLDLELRRFPFYPLNYEDGFLPPDYMQTPLLTMMRRVTTDPGARLIALWSLFILCLPLSLKKLLSVRTVDGALNEFASVALYATDIFAVGIVAYIVLSNKSSILSSIRQISSRWVVGIVAILGYAVLLIGASSDPLLSLWQMVRMSVIAAAMYLTYRASYPGDWTSESTQGAIVPRGTITQTVITQIVPRGTSAKTVIAQIVPRGTILKTTLLVLIVTGVVNSGVALWQFLLQHSIGMTWLRESIFSASIPGTAKIYILEHLFVRSYGLFPHPNILGGFLLLSIVATGAFAIRFGNVPRGTIPRKEKSPIVPRGTYAAIAIQIMALISTFSRSAIITGLFVALFWYGRRILKAASQRSIVLGTIALIIGICAMQYHAASPTVRIGTGMQSLDERLLYTDAAVKIITEKPLLGVGGGVFTQSIEKYAAHRGSIENWQHQPVHNVYLLIAAEYGIPAMLILVLLVSKSIGVAADIVPRGTISRKDESLDVPRGTSNPNPFLYVFAGFATIAAIDHYFWDIQQGIIMFMLCIMLINLWKSEFFGSK